MNRAIIRSLTVVTCLLLAGLVLLPANSAGQQSPRNIDRAAEAVSPPRTWAVLIGIERYDTYRPALYADADARSLKETLESRGQYDSTEVLLMVSSIKDEQPGLKPDFATITVEAPKFLAQAQEQDRVIFFFSGHGYLANNGVTYLAPLDVDVEQLRSAIPLSDVRDMLVDCRAATKLLILDACHSGNPKGNGPVANGVTSKEIELVLRNTAGIHTLASCQAAEVSWPDDRTRRGLYTYWLNRGLQGAADGNGDFKITPNELHEFVLEPVRLASLRFGKEQTPGQIVGPAVKVAPVLELRPDTWTDALPRVADLLHEQLVRSKLDRVGVLEFRRRDGQREQHKQLGVFGAFTADKIEESLQKAVRREDKPPYALIARPLVEGVVQGKTFEQVFQSKVEREQLGRNAQVDVVVTGDFQPLDDPLPQRFNLKCEAIRLDNGAVVASASAIVQADASLLSALGVSWSSPQVAEPAPGAPTSELASFLKPAPKFRVDESPGNPLLEDNSPLGVDIYVEGRKLEKFSGPADKDGKVNTVYVGAKANQEFGIRLTNTLAKKVAARVFVDGLNVINKTPIIENQTWMWGLDPNTHTTIDEWRQEIKKDGDAPGDRSTFVETPFVFVEPRASIAAKRGFGDNVGQITVVFWEARPMAWLDKLGVGEGQRRLIQTYPKQQVCLGRQLQSVTIHYVREESLRRVRR